jgi:hypothetical protein
MLSREQLTFVGRGDDSLLLVFTPPQEHVNVNVPNSCMAIPVLPREGGMLLAVPDGFLSNDALLDASAAEDADILGPSRDFVAPLLEEDESGLEVPVGVDAPFCVIDVTDGVLAMLREYDPVIDPSGEILPYVKERPLAIVDVSAAIANIVAWVTEVDGIARLNFYTAREEREEPNAPPHLPSSKAAPKRAGARKITNAALADTVADLAAQVKALALQQQTILEMNQGTSATPAPGPVFGASMPAKLPSVSAGLLQAQPSGLPKLGNLLGPPPKSKPLAAAAGAVDAGVPNAVLNVEGPPESQGFSQALMQQSQAITSLVAHLTSGDALTELSSSASSSHGLHTKGVMRREKMQQELANGSSNFFVQVQQQIHKRMFPSRPLPKDESDLVNSGATLCGYLEKFGGYKNRAETAMIMWMLGHAMDAAASGDDRLCKEYLALTVACIEQSVVDGGSWNLAYVLSLLEEPPSQVFSEKTAAVSSLGKPFAALVPPTWSAVSLAFLKELDLLTTKKAEAGKPKAAAKAEEPGPPSPKRRPKFPKKPKAGGEASPSSGT